MEREPEECESRYIKGERCEWKSEIKRCIPRQGKKKRRQGRDYVYETSNEPVEKFMDYKQGRCFSHAQTKVPQRTLNR